MSQSLFVYYATTAEPDQAGARRLLRALSEVGVDECLFRLHALRTDGAPHALWMIELLQLFTGQPVHSPALTQALSMDKQVAFTVALPEVFADADAASAQRVLTPATEAGFEVARDGAAPLSWAGKVSAFSALSAPAVWAAVSGTPGIPGFAAAFRELTGHDFEDLVRTSVAILNSTAGATGVEPEPEPLIRRVWSAGMPRGIGVSQHATLVALHDEAELLLRGRKLTLPQGEPFRPDVFAFHCEVAEPDDDDDDEQDAAQGSIAELELKTIQLPEGDQLALVLLDLGLYRDLTAEAPAQRLVEFLEAVRPRQWNVLGPLAHALPSVLEQLSQADEGLAQPLAKQDDPDVLTFEVAAMATALAFGTGAPVSDIDQLLLPMLSLDLSRPVPSPELLAEDYDALGELSVLSAMVEVLPYSVPEGELLECLADEEIRPICPQAIVDGEYDGSLFLAKVERLHELVERFDFARWLAFVRQFQERLRDLTGEREPAEAHHALLLADEEAIALFRHRFAELRYLLRLARENQLACGLLFYSN